MCAGEREVHYERTLRFSRYGDAVRCLARGGDATSVHGYTKHVIHVKSTGFETRCTPTVDIITFRSLSRRRFVSFLGGWRGRHVQLMVSGSHTSGTQAYHQVEGLGFRSQASGTQAYHQV